MSCRLSVTLFLVLVGMQEGLAEADLHQQMDSEMEQRNIDISVAMLGFVVISMASMYVLKSGNPILRTGGWLSLSKALSCFMGVLINMSLYGNLCYFLKAWGAKPPVELSNAFTVRLYFFLVFLWWVAKQTLLALGVGLFRWQQRECTVEQLAMRLDGLGTIIGFCSASAIMQAFAALQQMGRETDKEDMYVIGVVPLCAVSMYLLLRFANVFRDWIANNCDVVRSGKGVSDAHAAWGAYMDFSENKGVSLALSHCTVQAIRFYISGRNYCGVVGDRPQNLLGTPPALREVGVLLSCGTLFFILSSLSMALPQRLGRIKQWCKMSCSLAVAFCNLYAISYLAERTFPNSPTFAKMCATWGNTVLGAVLMLMLTKLIDVLTQLEMRHSAFMVQDLFMPVSVLVGFSWRETFQESMNNISGKFDQSVLAKPQITLIAAIIMLSLVAPAWYVWILPTTFKKWKVRSQKKGPMYDSLYFIFEPPPWLNHELKKAQWHSNEFTLTEALKDEIFAVGTDLAELEHQLEHKVGDALRSTGATIRTMSTRSNLARVSVESQVCGQEEDQTEKNDEPSYWGGFFASFHHAT